MGATVAFTDLGSLAGAGFPNISDLADQQLHLETEILDANAPMYA